ncbi:probable protein arginine N-methyltransferase 3 [Olea europaea var. sylvestris]|uniref:probable protein arginine N-methyltransferase 3 n=1 Tax=Olea europaea var. sylvestris TaxID=158386 RepID=UPI000C1CE132|nr:probable protein arginine N-methyltransferase 3 [Olea europaea var. sylvestris]
MATHLEEEENLNDLKMKQKLHDTEDDDGEEEEEEDQNWDDWKTDGEEEEELEGSKEQFFCLFCDSVYSSCSPLFEHCASAHHFDFNAMKKTHNLDFYKCLKLINYVRSQVAENRCWSCGMICQSKRDLQNHLHEVVNFESIMLQFDDNRYLKPILPDDALLYSFAEDEEDENGDDMSIDPKELVNLNQFEQISIDYESCSDRYPCQLTTPCENGGKEVASASDRGIKAGAEYAVSFFRNEEDEQFNESSEKIVANQIRNINKNYFGAYSSFGIHREMISDKVRTDAYQQAILENPSLLRGAIVMDVGCGTGILSLFAAQGGASRVIAVEASEKMAAVATQIAKDNGFLRSGFPRSSGQRDGVIEVVQGMVEDLDNATHIQPHSVDVLLSEWMGYCLLYESMLSTVLLARDRWLKPGGAILPDTATMFVAGFGKGGTSIPFWENVYGFNMSCIGLEEVENAARNPIVDVIDSCDIVTPTQVLQTFDLVTMRSDQMDFTAIVELEPKLITPMDNFTGSKPEITWCHGLVLWFETGFTERFCSELPTNLSTSPYNPKTHWSQTILTFREPIAMASAKVTSEKLAAVGTNACPAVSVQSRISVARAAQHRSIDISVELTGIGPDGRKRNWPVQLFALN